MMIDFIETVESPEINNNLQRLIQGKGAFRRFKDYCAEMNIIQEWYDFRWTSVVWTVSFSSGEKNITGTM